MLCKAENDPASPDGKKLKNMHIGNFPEMSLFLTEIITPEPGELTSAYIVVTYKPPSDPTGKTLRVPLEPDISGLEHTEISMHDSNTKAYVMPQTYSDWFSSCFGYEVIFVYLGDQYRDVRCTNGQAPSGGSWMSYVPIIGGWNGNQKERITFADCVPYLVVSETSLKDVSNRLPDGEDMDVTKFRPNIVVEGAPTEWEEDYWAEVQVGDAKIITAHNCARCPSINVDYSTGKTGTGESGKVLKKLQRDRRIDSAKCNKYSPVFGRYSFLEPKDDGKIIKVGEEVSVLKRNSEHTVFGK